MVFSWDRALRFPGKCKNINISVAGSGVSRPSPSAATSFPPPAAGGATGEPGTEASLSDAAAALLTWVKAMCVWGGARRRSSCASTSRVYTRVAQDARSAGSPDGSCSRPGRTAEDPAQASPVLAGGCAGLCGDGACSRAPTSLFQPQRGPGSRRTAPCSSASPGPAGPLSSRRRRPAVSALPPDGPFDRGSRLARRPRPSDGLRERPDRERSERCSGPPRGAELKPGAPGRPELRAATGPGAGSPLPRRAPAPRGWGGSAAPPLAEPGGPGRRPLAPCGPRRFLPAAPPPAPRSCPRRPRAPCPGLSVSQCLAVCPAASTVGPAWVRTL